MKLISEASEVNDRLLQNSTEAGLGVPSTNLYMKKCMLPDNILFSKHFYYI